MRPSGISQELELREFSELLFGSQDDSRSGRWFSTSQAPDAGPPAQGVHTSMGWARENWFGSNSLPVSQRVHKVSRILRWVFNRAWVVGPARRFVMQTKITFI
jgi:hypothetical protein